MVELNGIKCEKEQYIYNCDCFAYATLIIDDVGFVAVFFFFDKSVEENTYRRLYALYIAVVSVVSSLYFLYCSECTLKKNIYAFNFYFSNFLRFSNQKHSLVDFA